MTSMAVVRSRSPWLVLAALASCALTPLLPTEDVYPPVRQKPVVASVRSRSSTAAVFAAPSAAPVASMAGADVVRVKGRVRVRGDLPWPGVRVVAARVGREGGAAVDALTDEAGEFELPLTGGEWVVWLLPRAAVSGQWLEPEAPLEAGDWPEPAVEPREHQVRVRPGEARLLELRVRSDVVVAGRVIDDRHGLPVAGAEVFLAASDSLDAGPRGRPVAVTDEVGRFASVQDTSPTAATSLPQVTVVRARGWALAAVRSLIGGSIREDVVPDLEVRLTRPLHLLGRVEDPRGAPIAGAHLVVSAHLPDQGGWRSPFEPRVKFEARGQVEWRWELSSGPDGSFTVDDLAATGPDGTATVRIEAYSDDHVQREPCETFVGPGAATFRVVMTRPATVRGAVVDAEGRPIANVRVARYLNPAGPRFRPSESGVEPGVLLDHGPGRFGDGRFLARRGRSGFAAGSRDDGTFVLKRLPEGRHELAVWAAGYGEEFVTVDAPADDVRVVLSPERRLTGRVVDARGAGVTGAHVRVFRFGSGSAAAEASVSGEAWDGRQELGAAITVDGEFTVGGLAAEQVDVVVLAGHRVVARRAGVRSDGGPIELVARPLETDR